MSPLNDESRLNSEEHIEFLAFVLNLFGKSWDIVVALIGDNVSINQSISNKLQIPLVGCASHRLNLAVRDVMSNDERLINKDNNLMLKLQNLVLSAKLRRMTLLRPLIRSTTRWSSTFNMVNRYIRFREFVEQTESVEIDEMMLMPSENRKVDVLIEKLKDYESVSKASQIDVTTLSDVRTMFDELIEEDPCTEGRLSPIANMS